MCIHRSQKHVLGNSPLVNRGKGHLLTPSVRGLFGEQQAVGHPGSAELSRLVKDKSMGKA